MSNARPLSAPAPSPRPHARADSRWVLSSLLLSSALSSATASCSSSAQNAPAPEGTTSAAAAPTLKGVEAFRWQAPRVAQLFRSPLVGELLAGVAELPSIAPRKLYRTEDKSRWYSEKEYLALPAAEQAQLKLEDIDEETYYTTHYGSSLSYARPLELLAARGVTSMDGKKVLDFGYGYIGHLRLLALAGADMHGVDVAEMYQKLYSDASDTGQITSRSGKTGRITLHHGKYPADPKIAAEVGEGYDIIISKNVLKLGYIHPQREADPKRLVHLEVTDDQFLAAANRALKPGGLMLIYNLAPAQAPADKPYIPWADGTTPFTKETWDKAGFNVLDFDKVDHDSARAMARALGWDLPYDGEPGMDVDKDLFAWYTLAQKR